MKKSNWVLIWKWNCLSLFSLSIDLFCNCWIIILNCYIQLNYHIIIKFHVFKTFLDKTYFMPWMNFPIYLYYFLSRIKCYTWKTKGTMYLSVFLWIQSFLQVFLVALDYFFWVMQCGQLTGSFKWYRKHANT